jgi:proline racemase/trans-L-3-hydroxyproline dehydratase
VAASGWLEVRSTDYHTAGEPFRIVTSGVPEIPGTTVTDRREVARRNAEVDHVRRLLCHEPRGHADMYGCFLVPPDDAAAHLGALFWHKDGYSTACGHGTIALGAWAVESGRVPAAPDGETDVVIDVPSGRVVARVRCSRGKVRGVTFRNVESYPLGRDVTVETSRGQVRCDLAWGGAIYASVAAADLGLEVVPDSYTALIAAGREIKQALADSEWARHPSDSRLDGVYGTIIHQHLSATENGLHQRNVTVFADGEVDRSPCGSGTSARLALLVDSGEVPRGAVLTHVSVVGTRFLARAVGPGPGNDRGVVTEVEGLAHQTGEHLFVLDPEDSLDTGFVLR